MKTKWRLTLPGALQIQLQTENSDADIMLKLQWINKVNVHSLNQCNALSQPHFKGEMF